MTQPVDIDLNLDPSGYVSGLRTASGETTAFAGTLRTTGTALMPLQKAMSAITPSRAMLAGQTAFVAMAARTQRELSGVQATAAVTNVNVGKLTGTMRDLAKQYPIGNTGARQVVQGITQMGVAAKGSEKQIGELAKSFVRLGGSTGENVQSLSQGMIQLSRSMNTGLNPKRVEAMADSLVEVTKATGTSATGVLAFSKSIAPLANSVGIGQTAVQGISASFSRMGEDGFAGAMAINKVFTDLNTSLREGTPQIGTYAQFVGKTREEFEGLVKNNPAEAVVQVMESIAKAGPRGQTMLEQLGIEGVRSQRAIVGAVSGGSLRSDVATAIGGYGTGANEKASAAAYGGLADSVQRLGAASEQAAEALGGPFLSAATFVTNRVGDVASGAGKVAGSGPVQAALTGAAWLAIPAFVTAKLLPALLKGLGLSQLATSGPIRALAGGFGGGFADSRYGSQAMFGATRSGRFGADSEFRRQGNLPMGQGPMAGVNRWFGNVGAGIGQAFGQYGPQAGPRGILSPMQTIRGIGLMGAGTYLRMMEEQARLARVPAADRTSIMRPRGAAYDRWAQNREYARYSAATYGTDEKAGLKAANDELRRELRGTGGAVRQFGNVLRGAVMVPGQAVASAGVLGARAVGRFGGSLARSIGPLGGIMMGGMAAFQTAKGVREGQENMASSAATNNSVTDDYRQALGKATDATQTFAGRMAEAATSIASSTTSMAEAFEINARDLTAADGATKIRKYGSEESALASLRMQQTTYGLDADELTRASYDLINEYGQDTAQRILDQLQVKPGAGARSLLTTAGSGSAQPQLGDEFGGTGGVRGLARSIGEAEQQGGIGGAFQRSVNWLKDQSGFSANTGRWYSQTTSDETQQDARDLGTNIRDRMGMRGEKYGDAYARQEAMKEMDAAVEEALASGNMSAVNDIVSVLQAQTIGADNAFRINEHDLREKGFVGAMRGESEAFAENYGPQQGTVRPELRESYYIDMLRAGGRSGNPLEALFTRTGVEDLSPSGQGANEVFQRLLTDKAGDPGYQTGGLASAMRYFTDAGTSMSDLATAAAQTVNDISNLGDAGHQAAAALRQAATTQMSRQAQDMTPGAGALMMGDDLNRVASMTPTNQAGIEQRQGAERGLQEIHDNAKAQLRAVLSNHREMQVSLGRADTDHRRQVRWNNADHERQLGRVREDAGRARQRQQEAFARQELRNQEDFARQMRRGQEDFDLSMLHAHADYNRQRQRQQRDFDRQLARQIADAAKSMYDPYQRIQVQPVWDAGTLGVNLTEQTEALERQVRQIEELRSRGLSVEAVDLLGLADPKNAQQVAQTLSDIVSDPAVTGRLNELAARRTQAAGGLLTNENNVDFRRQVEDYSIGMQDAATEFEISSARALAAFVLNNNRSWEEFRINLGRGRTDLNIQLGLMEQDVARTIDRANEDFEIGADRTTEMFNTMAGRARDDMIRSTQTMLGTIEEMIAATNGILRGEFVEYGSMAQSGLEGLIGVLEAGRTRWHDTLMGYNVTLDFQVNGQRFGTNGVGGARPAADRGFAAPAATGAGWTGGGRARNAEGGVFVKGGAPRTWGEESDEILLPLDARGSRFLAETLGRLSVNDHSALATSGTAQAIHYHSDTHTYDYSTVVEHVELTAPDPREALEQMAAEQRRSNLTSPAQRRGGR